jgi:hypothetical protein
LRGGKEDCDEHPDVRNVCESRKIAANPLLKSKQTTADEEQHQEHGK